MSLDGYFEGPNIGWMDLNMDEFFDAHNLECSQAADTVLLGTASYTGFSGYWPFVEKHPQLPANGPMALAYDQTNRANSRNWNSKPIVVVSDSYQVPDDGPWASHITVIGRDEVARWKQDGAAEEVLVFAVPVS